MFNKVVYTVSRHAGGTFTVSMTVAAYVNCIDKINLKTVLCVIPQPLMISMRELGVVTRYWFLTLYELWLTNLWFDPTLP